MRRPRPEAGDRTVGRAQLAGRSRFGELSPQVGVLDAAAVENAMAADPEATLALLAEMARATDEKLRRAARELAGRIVLDRVRTGVPRARGISRLRAIPADRGGDLDLDASLPVVVDARIARRPAHLSDLTARAWSKPELALCLLVDASGSMGGERLAAAALTAAACALRAPGEYAVLSFAREVTVLKSIDAAIAPQRLVDAVLGLRGHGVTALQTALRAATEALERSRASRRVVILLSDCRATDEQDPVPAAARVPELVILAPAQDCEQAADLALRAGARWAPLAGAWDCPAALLGLLRG
ncbi:MAG: VWA domain-containing protein [Sporichthyaceae bacterium]